jgi:PPOX class probable F420-dependent enzyme
VKERYVPFYKKMLAMEHSRCLSLAEDSPAFDVAHRACAYAVDEENSAYMIELSAELQRLLQKRAICFFATIMPDGSPQMTQTWVDTDGTYILINTVEGHQKHRNVQRDPRVVLSVIDPAHWERAVSIRGHVVEITKEGADLHFKHLIERNLGHGEYRYGKPGQVRILLKIAPEKIRL